MSIKRKNPIGCGSVLLVTLLAFIVLGEGAARNCPANEFYTECGDNCQTECATLNQPCYINYFRCPDGCYCNKGFARDAQGKCIPIGECP